MDRVGLVAQVAAWSVLLVLAGCDDGGGPVGSPPTFTELATGLTGVDECSLAWGDADNDGDLDLAVAGHTGSGYITKVYENRNGQLDAAWELATGLTGVLRCSLAWGDADNDGDLDLVVAGLWTGSARITKFYENDGPLPNTRPGAPTGLEHVGDILGFHVLQCNAASDAETPAEGLSYNLMVREASGLTHVYPAMADETTGARRVPALGPVLHRKPYVVFAITLPPGDYEARVQAIDTAFEGGAWSQPCLFTAQ